MHLSIENFTCPKEQISLFNNLFFQKQYETRYIILVKCMDPDQLAFFVNSVDPDQLKKPADKDPHCFQSKM